MEKNDSKKLTYESLWKAIIRPPRDEYTLDELGPKKFHYKNKTYIRKDLEILDNNGYFLKLSIIEPEDFCRPTKIMPIVLYLHSNASSRIEGLYIKKYLLKHDINLCVFDFEGCGLSEGEYISLGYHEKNQVKTIINLLYKYKGVGKIGIWGRSMGAATALLYSSTNNDKIKCLVVDSPFCDFKQLAKETCLKNSKVPGFLIDAAISFIGKSVKKKNGMKINEIKPIEAVKNCEMPVIFIHTLDDNLVAHKHSEDLILNYKGKNKILKSINGGHNAQRPTILMEFVGNFFSEHLMNDEEKNLDLINNKCKDDVIGNCNNDKLIYNNSFQHNHIKNIYDDLKLNNNNINDIKSENSDDKKDKNLDGLVKCDNGNNIINDYTK